MATTAPVQSRSALSSITTSIRAIYRARLLLVTLTARDLKARYRGSILGYFWSLANPLLLLGVYTIVFTKFFPRPDVQPYALFLFTGILPWTFFAGAVLEGVESIAANGALIKKVTFPAETLPLVVVLSHLVHFLLALPILMAALMIAVLFAEVPLTLSILWFPLIALLLTLFIAGVTLSLASVAVMFRDLRDIVANLLNLGFFLTPILYSTSSPFISDSIAIVLRVNPVTPYVLAFQSIFFFGAPPSTIDWVLMTLFAVVSVSAGLVIFDRLRDQLAEAI